MNATTGKTFPPASPRTYAELVAQHMPRPIHDEVSYRNTVAMIDALAGFNLNRDQEDYLELLAQLVETYETQTLPKAARVSGREALRFILAENNLTGDDLAGILGIERSVAYRILQGKRNLTAEHIRKLSSRFKVTADVFLATAG